MFLSSVPRNNARYLWKRIPPAIKSVSSGPNFTQKSANLGVEMPLYTRSVWRIFFWINTGVSFCPNRQMLSSVRFGRWDKGSGRGISRESTQQSVPISGLRPSSQSWKHSEVQAELVWGAGNCLELFMAAPTQAD